MSVYIFTFFCSIYIVEFTERYLLEIDEKCDFLLNFSARFLEKRLSICLKCLKYTEFYIEMQVKGNFYLKIVMFFIKLWQIVCG